MAATPGPSGRRRRAPGEARWWYLYRAMSGPIVGYIGISCDPEARFWEHHAEKPWIREITAWPINMMERYPSWRVARAAERAAIARERPLFNIEDNWHNPRRVNPHTMRYVAGPMQGHPYRPELYRDVHEGRWAPPAARRVASPESDRTAGRRAGRQYGVTRHGGRRHGVTRRRGDRSTPFPLGFLTWALLLATLLPVMPPLPAGITAGLLTWTGGQWIRRRNSRSGSRRRWR